jgi:trehalose 6-phosphate synthase
VGVLAALQRTGGLWFGWSGEVNGQPPRNPSILVRDSIRFATIDLEPRAFERYYNGYCNSTLWPLFHYAIGRFHYDPEDYEAYQAVNARFARQLLPLLRPDDVVWVHDYHLISLARHLRHEGFGGPIGYFLHIPFPNLQVLRLLPSHVELVQDLCRYDLVGFQTQDDLASFESCLPRRRALSEVAAPRTGVYPIGIDVEQTLEEARTALTQDPVERLTASLLGRRLIIGVDRLDYSKGLSERFEGFEHFLTAHPEHHGRVTFLQIAPLSRPDVLAYGEIRATLEQTAGRLNGRFAEADWTPVRYLNRNFSHHTLMGFLRAAQVGLVTPVRDGMNLVAKEFVAAQSADDPGVLILSPFAGAARELTGALLVNPYDKRGLAQALHEALQMPRAERQQRHRQMLEALRGHDIHDWCRRFLSDLTGESASALVVPHPALAHSTGTQRGAGTSVRSLE